jgi:hypothetical protein
MPRGRSRARPERGIEPLEVAAGIHVEPSRKPCDSEAEGAGARHRIGQDPARAPRDVLEQLRAWRAESDEVVTAVLAGAEDDAGIRVRDHIQRLE